MLLSLILWEMYSKNASEGKGVGKPNYTLIESILEGIEKWGTKQAPSSLISLWGINPSHNMEWKPVLNNGEKIIKPISIRLIRDNNDDLFELKFGDFESSNNNLEIYKIDPNDPQRLHKAVWVEDVIMSKILPLINDGMNIKFHPFDEDGLEDYRLGLFKKIYNKLDKTKFQWNNLPDKWYSITKI